MHRFTIQRKISATLLGATYECLYNAPPPPAALAIRLPVATKNHRPRSTIALKCSSLRSHKRLQAMLERENKTAALDDPVRERDVVAALIASGGHDHVLQCYDHFTTEDETGDACICIVTEFCNGGDLFSFLSTTSRGVGETDAISLMLQVARGVLFLHSRLGLAHRDLSLENVFLRDGVCKLADFGLATPLNEKCHSRVGKQAYMAPEVVSSPADGYNLATTEVWSLGVMLFMLLTGSPIVDIASPEDPRFVALTRHGVSAILSAWGVEASRGLVELLDAMLRRDPSQRPSVARVALSLSELEADALAAAERRSSL